MTSHSPQRRKSQAQPLKNGPMQTQAPRDMSPSPSFRESRRAAKGQSMPLVPSVMSIFPNSNQPGQHSPTGSISSHHARRSPPPPPPMQANVPGLPSPSLNQDPPPPPPPIHPLSQSNIHQPIQQQPQPQHTHSLPNIHNPQLGYPRPINRVPPPKFLNSFHVGDEKWQMTEELYAEIERADQQAQGQNTGTSGVAYAGGAASAGISSKDLGIDRLRQQSEKSNLKEADRRQTRDSQGARDSPSSKNRDRQHSESPHSPERRDSPQYQPPLNSQGDHTTGYTQHKRESLLSSKQTPPMGGRTPDRSLPVQEELEDDVAVGSKNGRDKWGARMDSPTPSSDLHPEGRSQRYEPGRGGRDSRTGHRNDDSETLIEHDGDEQQFQTTDEEGTTPRSPTAELPEHPPDILLATQNTSSRLATRPRGRGGSTDQLGLRSIDPALFEQVSVPRDAPRYNDSEHYRRYIQQQQQQHHQYQSSRQSHDGYMSDQNTSNGRYYPSQVPSDLESLMNDPTGSYIQAYLQSPRPNAPIPPTPHTHTAAPSPSPLVSGSEAGFKEFPPPIPGSPYPYPFSHVRRTHSYSGNPSHPPPSSNYDPNHPSVVQEQLALQWQMYALNNHGHVTDSTLSPSSTPFRPPGYNPWVYLHTNRAGGRRVDPTMSLRSSPSHEPVNLPPPPTRGSRGIKRRDKSANLRNADVAIRKKPPPRVDSTQPRETSPEPYSSGEETAGEEHFEIEEEVAWMNPILNDDPGDWVDEDGEGEEDDDLLELEYHPTFVSNTEKRRRRWETRWESLVEAFQALDRQTDATLVLLAAPSHSTKFHSMSSRSIRRDPTLLQSPAMAGLRASFRHVASQRRIARSRRPSLADRLLLHSGSSGDGSDSSSESREVDLKRALEAALGSLGALSKIYDEREARWRDEMRRVSNDREHVEMLLKQALGAGSTLPAQPNGTTSGDAVGRAL